MRLIDADVLKEKLIEERDAIPVIKTERYSFGVGLPNPHGMSMRGGINKAFRCMEQTPTIDAVPVVHGRWEERKRPTEHLVCSACCRKNFMRVKSDYCPNCGARMDGE